MRSILNFILVLITLSISSIVHAETETETIKPFTSDGCSIFPDGTFEHKDLWLACCTAHDYAYWKGGTQKQKEKADKELRQCVAKVGQPKIAELMLAGVKVGGNPYLPTPFRWGYGWPYPRDFKALTEEELEQIKSLTPSKE